MLLIREMQPETENAFIPTHSDVKRYQQLRGVCRAMSDRMVLRIPSLAYDDIGNALGILHGGKLILETEDMCAVLADCCLYDWYQNGENLVQRYAAECPSEPGSDEEFMLSAMRQERYRILQPLSRVAGAGLQCQDMLTGEKLFLMDVGFSSTSGSMSLATRTFPLGDYWISGGAALPISSKETIESLEQVFRQPPDDFAQFELAVVRACLQGGAAERIRYAGPGSSLGVSRPREPRWIPKRRRRLHS